MTIDAAHPPTEEQQDILAKSVDFSNNLLINAFAGTGKTTTLEMIQGVVKTKPILYLCFNKKIADEARDKFPSTTTVKTLNALGHGIWARTQAGKLSLDAKKSQTILSELTKTMSKKAQGPIWDSFWDIVGGVSMAKALGYVPDGKFPNAKRLTERSIFHEALEQPPDDLTADLIDSVLTTSITQAYKGHIDFNDQVYMPALFGGTFPQFPLVKVDETQDLNPVNHAMLDKLVKHRLMAVGDPFQSIYGFRGAVQGGMAKLKAKFSMTEATLSVSFRCPQKIVENARWRVPKFQWIKTGGRVEFLRFMALTDFTDSDVILCRNNAPLFRLGLRLLLAGRGVSISGSDVGPRIVATMKKLGDEDMSKDSLVSRIEDWRAEKIAKGSKIANDMADCMLVFAEHSTSLSTAISYAEHLFSQRGMIRLMTGHKAKGLEFPSVYHLDPWIIGEHEQDLNIRYVIQTRSQDSYKEISSRSIL